MKLSAIQEKIVNQEGNLIVRASAGTGKTHTMVTKIAKELEENRSHKVIAAITFTIKAAQEIKDRLSVDVTQQFIGTNNGFVIEEIIKPFMKDVYGSEYNVDIDTDYIDKFDDFEDGLSKIKDSKILGSYTDSKKNFAFELAKKIVENSECCRLYLKAKYFKIYIDEYQDCDKDMHNLFMYICDELEIETFVVGDEKQSIYMWRGAYPEAFKSIWHKTNFSTIFMGDNFRSCQQIQNYTNLLCEETRHLYSKVDDLNSIVMIHNTSNIDIWKKILANLDSNKKSALLRFSNDNAKAGAKNLSINDILYVYIPTIPIADITTESAWLYMSIASFCIVDNYSVYDFVSEIPVESDESKKSIKKMKQHLDDIKRTTIESNKLEFDHAVKELAIYLGLGVREEHLAKLYRTIAKDIFHVAFEADKYKHVAITFHSSKGLEFEQVILFAEDYRLSDMSSIYNHYVASTRAKEKLIIVYDDTYNSKQFRENLKLIINKCNKNILNLVTFK